MKIGFIRSYDFPLGGAPQNRAMQICKALVENGCKVEVHIFTPGRLDLELNRKKEQIYQSVQIFNHSWKQTPFKGKRQQIFGIMGGLVRTFSALIKSHKKEHFDWIFLNNNRNIYAVQFFILSKYLGLKLGRELNEFPEYVLKPNKFSLFGRFYRQKTNYIWFDVFLIMTNKLLKYYKSIIGNRAKFLLLPMTVDMSRFNKTVKDLHKQLDITYIGDLSQDKDGVFDLINSFSLIKNDFPKVRLKLIGKNKDQNHMSKLLNLVSELGLVSRVEFTGYINPEQIPEELYNSRLMVLSRPDSKQAQGGFPTKLGEYLATGVPVVITKVGEIPDFLENYRNAFFADPGDINGFANAMRKALSDIKLSIKVGLAGRETAIKYFSHSVQGSMIKEFLNENIKDEN